MKKFIAMLSLLVFLSTNTAGAIIDIPDDYWANIEVNDMVDSNIIPLDGGGYFNPNDSVFRTDFTGWLLKVLQQGAPNVMEERPFLDVDPNTRGYYDILKSKEVGLVYGYNDGYFRPVKNITRAETQSIMSHITRELFDDLSPLDPFVDKDQIPFWDLNQYAKTIYLGLYVNHPELEKLEPNRELTRAEAAVLLYRLKMALNLVKDEYKIEEDIVEEPPEQMIGSEELVYDKCGLMQNQVNITNQRKILLPGNIFSLKFNQKFSPKSSNTGTPVQFVLDYDLMTTNGTVMLPRGTKAVGEVQQLKGSKAFIEIKEFTTPDGKNIPTKAIVYNKTMGYQKAANVGDKIYIEVREETSIWDNQ